MRRSAASRQVDRRERALKREHDTYSMLQWAEIESCLGAWVEAAKPAFGPEAAQNFDHVRILDRRRVRPAAQRREEYF